MLRNLTYLSISIFLFAACGSTQDLMDDNVLIPLVELYKSPCYGTCPNYKMTVYKNGKIKYNGLRFTDMQGLHERKITPPEVADLTRMLERANLWEYNDEYNNGIADAQMTRIKYYDEDGRSKTIESRGEMPSEQLSQINDHLMQFTRNGDWTLVEGALTPNQTDGLPTNAIPNELIIKLTPDLGPELFANRFAKQRMVLKQTVSAPMHIYLFGFDENTMTPLEMIEAVRKTEGVIEVEFNKQLDSRS